jgi:hypothetical protein
MKGLFLLLGFCSSAVALADGHLRLYRWDQGYRAHREAAWSTSVTEQELRAVLDGKTLPAEGNPQVYAGCYLALYERSSQRKPASLAEMPRAEIHRICFPRR